MREGVKYGRLFQVRLGSAEGLFEKVIMALGHQRHGWATPQVQRMKAGSAEAASDVYDPEAQ